jgi:hypothetical protein
MINVFTDADECIDFISEIKDERIFTVVSDGSDQHIVPLIHEITQLDSVYVFYDFKIKHEIWENQLNKVKGAFTEIESICNCL